MERPGWVTVVGIIGIIIGFFGILGAGKSIMLPGVIEFQKKIITVMHDISEITEEDFDFEEEIPPEKIFKIGAKLLDLPEWFYKWSIAFGFIGLFISGFYMFASIWLLLMKSKAVRIFYLAICLSILLSIVKTIVALSTMSIVGFFLMGGFSLGIAINIILLIVVLASDKSAFQKV